MVAVAAGDASVRTCAHFVALGTLIAVTHFASRSVSRCGLRLRRIWPAAWRPRSRVQQENLMLTTLATTGLLAQALPGGLIGIAVIFFIIAILAYVLGARGVAGVSAGIGRTLLFVFLGLAVVLGNVRLVRPPYQPGPPFIRS